MVKVRKVVIALEGDKGEFSVSINPATVAAVFFSRAWANEVRDVSGSICTPGWEALMKHANNPVLEGPPGVPWPTANESSSELGDDGELCIKLRDCTWWCPEE